MIVVCAFCFGEFEFILETRDSEKRGETGRRLANELYFSSNNKQVLPPREEGESLSRAVASYRIRQSGLRSGKNSAVMERL